MRSSINIDTCPCFAMDDMDNHIIEIDKIPECLEELYLAYENICNYHRMSYTIHDIMLQNKAEDLEKGFFIQGG